MERGADTLDRGINIADTNERACNWNTNISAKDGGVKDLSTCTAETNADKSANQ